MKVSDGSRFQQRAVDRVAGDQHEGTAATARCSGLEITTVGCFAANACASLAASAIPTRSSGDRCAHAADRRR
jgi:hypothetical protein